MPPSINRSLTPQQLALKQMFPDAGVYNAAQGASDWYNSFATPEWVESNNFNYGLPTAENDYFTARLYADMARPENDRSADAQNVIDMYRNQAQQGEFVGPELMRAYEEARTLAQGGDGPVMTAQKDMLARGLNSGLQTALRLGRIGALAGGVRGGGEAAIANPAIRDFASQYGQGLQQLQLGNLNSYYNLAGQVDSERFNRRNAAYSGYQNAVGSREAFEAQRYNDRLGRYNNVTNQHLDRYFTLKQADQQRRDAFMGGRVQAPFLGASVGEQRLGRQQAEKFGQAAINSAHSFQVPSFGVPHGASSEVFQRPS